MPYVVGIVLSSFTPTLKMPVFVFLGSHQFHYRSTEWGTPEGAVPRGLLRALG
jgi:hypothetical protein